MATVSITIPDTLVPRLTAAMRGTYTGTAFDALTDVQCFKQVTADFWRKVLVDYESDQAQTTALASVKAARDQANTDGAGIG